MTKKYDKTVAPRVWKSWKIVAMPTETTAMIRKDESGTLWEALFKIQNFYIRRVNK